MRKEKENRVIDNQLYKLSTKLNDPLNCRIKL